MMNNIINMKGKYNITSKKILVYGVLFLLIAVAIIPSINASLIKGSSYDKENKNFNALEKDSDLDLEYIYNLTENLSNIIFTEYNESAGEIAKGRAFGSKGEHKAAEILYGNMTKLGLDTKYEKINNTKEKPFLTTKIDKKEIGLSIYNKTSHNLHNVTDFYNSGRWNFTGINYILEDLKAKKPLIGFLIEKLIKSYLFIVNGTVDQRLNLYDFDRLNYNFSYKGLKVLRKPSDYSLIKDIARGIKNNEPFVYIGNDYDFTEWEPENLTFNGFIYKIIFKLLGDIGVGNVIKQQLLWSIFQPNCKGLILVDSNYDTYNMGTYLYCPLPIIKINRTDGEEIINNPGDFEIDFYLNQEYNDSVISYNVIGKMEGKNKDETIIVCSLYDSWWCQGTADSAIGMATVLGIAKYFKDNNITPERNIEFIAFGAEEYGFRGAFHYENTNRDKFISYVLDLNQLGFTPIIPENLRFQIWSNDEIVNESMVEFIKNTNYSKRTGVEYKTSVKPRGGPSNANAFALANLDKKRKCKTILLVKTGFYIEGPDWLHHHRDGIKHTAGDVIDYFNWTDTEVTGELALNITKYLAIEKEDENPDDYKFKQDFITKNNFNDCLILKD